VGTYNASTCMVADTTMVEVVVGYMYQPLTPLPSIGSSRLYTSAQTEVLEEA